MTKWRDHIQPTNRHSQLPIMGGLSELLPFAIYNVHFICNHASIYFLISFLSYHVNLLHRRERLSGGRPEFHYIYFNLLGHCTEE